MRFRIVGGWVIESVVGEEAWNESDGYICIYIRQAVTGEIFRRTERK